ncbi:MAG: outer membrane protein assembly factor [Planctomycetota bacterium]
MGISFLLLFVSMFSSSWGHAREGEEVVAIRVVGNRRVTNEQMLQNMRTRVGRPLRAADVTEDIRDIYERFGIRVSVLEESVAGGVRLTLNVDEEALVSGVETRGVPAGRGAELLELVSLDGVRSLLESQIRDRALTMQRLLQEEGYYFAEVKATVDRREHESVAVLEIHEGPKVEVEGIEFLGLETVDPDSLEQVMTTRPTRLLLIKSYLRRDALDRDIIELQRFLQEEGYRDGQAALDAVEFNTAQDEATVKIRIQEGVRYSIGEIRIEGNTALLDQELYAEIRLREGDPIRMTAVDKDLRRIVARYGELGYVRCRAESKIAFGQQGSSVSLTYVVDEGNQKRIRDVVIRGNTNTRDEIIRRESTLNPGDIASSKELRRTSERLRALGYFDDGQGRSLVHARFEETGDPLLEDMFVDVEETQSGGLAFWAAANTDIGFYGGVHLVKNNFDLTDAPSSWDPITLFSEFWRNEAFHGGGQQLIIQALPGNNVSTYRVSFTEPYLTGPDEDPVSLNVDAYYRPVRLVDEYSENRLGLATTLSRRIDEDWTAGVTGRLELVTIDDVDGDAPADVKDVKGGNFVPSLGVFGRYQQVDSILDPSDGFEVGGRYELLLGDAFGHRAVLDGEYFLPIMEDDLGREQVLAVRGAVGAAQGFGGDLPFFERFTSGGASGDFPLRGFEYRRVGPESKDVHLGGELAWAASAEYRFPLYSSYDPMLDEEVELLRGVVFADAGSIEDTLGDLIGNPRLALGVGVRVRLPFLGPTPVAIDLGVPVLSASSDETELFSIRVKTRF